MRCRVVNLTANGNATSRNSAHRLFEERFTRFLIDEAETESREEWDSRRRRPCGV